MGLQLVMLSVVILGAAFFVVILSGIMLNIVMLKALYYKMNNGSISEGTFTKTSIT
jgi:hypothetical protein